MTHDLQPIPNEVASELLTDAIPGTARCPICCNDLTKTVFSDGDAESCTHCGEALWFEIHNGQVRTHQANPKPRGMTFSELMASRQKPSEKSQEIDR